jgi:uroporphyrinogen decarboxylase
MLFNQFWKNDEIAHKENCFYKSAPQVALGLRMSEECVFAELDEEGDPWGITNPIKQYDLNKRYNDKAEKVVSRRLLPENPPEMIVEFPYIKRIGEVFGGEYHRQRKTGEWLHSPIDTPKKLEQRLNYVDQLDLVSFILPDEWEQEKRRLFETTGCRPKILRHIRGPVTLATSIYGVKNLIYLFYDAKELFIHFSESILRIVLMISQIMDCEAGFTSISRPSGFSFADDDCSLLSPDMYKLFGYPILKGVFDYYSPNPDDKRFQHSDSAMAHLLPQLSKLNLTGCNFGPTVLVDEIRKYMPKTRIDGCLAPFTFLSNDPKQIREEIKRDCEMIKATKGKGLNICTAGSVNNGSTLESLRTVITTILEFGSY